MDIASEIVDKVRDAADIVKVIGEFVTLKKRGHNWWGCCPFHNENTASFSVSPDKQIYKCFGCGEGGNVFNFLMKHEKLSFPEAIRMLGKQYNIEVPERELTPEEKARESRRESLQVAMRAAASFYQKQLAERRAVEYLQNRGFATGPDSIPERFMVGFAPDGDLLYETLSGQGFDVKILEDNSLVSTSGRRPSDRFRDRIVFPILSLTGSPVGFQTRRIDDSPAVPKYCNSDNTELFKKSSALFGLFQAKKAIGQLDKVYWVEGQMDVMAWAKCGIENVVGGSGTAMSAEQVKLLLRFTNNITLVYDGDAAGIKAARTNIPLLVEMGAAVRCVALPDGEDPDSFARKLTPEALRTFVGNNEVDFATYLAGMAKPDFADPEKKEKALTEIIGLIAKLKRETLQAAYLKNIAALFEIDRDLLRKKIREETCRLPEEEGMKDDFYGVEEASELLKENNGICVLTADFTLFSRYYGADPAVYFNGFPPKQEIQKFHRLISCVEFAQTELLMIGERDESEQLLLLKELFRHRVTVNIRENGGLSVGLVQYYMKIYGELMADATETQKAVYVDRCAELVSYAGDTVRTVMAKTWAKALDLTVGQYQDVLKPYLEKRRAKSAISIQQLNMDEILMVYDPEKTPDYVEESNEYRLLYRKHGFYPLLNKDREPVSYMFKLDKGGHIQVADFYMIPLLHIYDQDSEYNKRVIKINRLYAKQPVYLEVKSKQMASLTAFEEVLMNEEALNFANGDMRHFKTIRQVMSYKYTKCVELKTFGQQSENFFAFANAIFHEVDGGFSIEYANDLGVMSHESQNYYTPAYSKIYSGLRKDSDRYEQHRYFIYKDIPEERRCTFERWTALMNEVYTVNDNGKWAVIYAIMCAFRSDIHVIDRLFTALFFVGPTMSGKTQVAISIRSLYVDPKAPSFNLNSGTDAAFFTLMEGFRDVPQVLEEYNNKDISKDKFQGLKAITYDGDGKQKRKGVSDREIDTSKVNSPVIILGQETPERDDNALMNRVVLCEVPKPVKEYSQHETEVFQRLKDYEKGGLCNVLFEVLKLRPVVRDYFKEIERAANRELTDGVLGGTEASGDMVRIIKTVSLFLAMCKLLEAHAPQLKLPFTYAEFFKLAKEKVKWQIELISHTDKLAGFFKAIEVMVNIGSIKEGRDYAIVQTERLTLKAAGGDTKQIVFPVADTKVLFVRLSNLFALYAKSSYNSENATLSTIEQNLRSNSAYIGVVSSRKFRWKEVSEVAKSEATGDMEMRRVMADRVQITSCIALNYDVFRRYFDIDLERAGDPEEHTDGLKQRPLNLEQPE